MDEAGNKSSGRKDKPTNRLSSIIWGITKDAGLRLLGLVNPSVNFTVLSSGQDLYQCTRYSPAYFAIAYGYWSLRVWLESKKTGVSGSWYRKKDTDDGNIRSLKKAQYEYGKIGYGAIFAGNLIWSSLLFVGSTVVNLAIVVIGLPSFVVAFVGQLGFDFLGNLAPKMFGSKSNPGSRDRILTPGSNSKLLDDGSDDEAALELPERETIKQAIEGLSSTEYNMQFQIGDATFSIQSLLAQIDLKKEPDEETGYSLNRILGNIQALLEKIQERRQASVVLLSSAATALSKLSEQIGRSAFPQYGLSSRSCNIVRTFLQSEVGATSHLGNGPRQSSR